MNNEEEKCFYSKVEEVNIMPSINLIEYDKMTYIKEMEEYLQKLKAMERTKARKKSYESLLKSEIITENGDFSERYKYTKMFLQKKV